MNDVIRAPWTSEQVQALNLFQERGSRPPVICGAEEHASGRSPLLDATHSGWVCPDPACPYTQDWAWRDAVDYGAGLRGAARTASGQQPETVQSTLRERLRRAVCEAEGFTWDSDMLEPDEYGDHADAALAEHEAADQPDSVVVDEFIRDMAAQHPACACTHPQDRHLSACTECPCVGYAPTWPRTDAPAVGQPAEAQATDEARPAQHRWAAELHDPLADEWVPGTRYPDRDRAVAALAHARAVRPTWKDGTPLERRLVRETTTWTVEDETR